MQSIGSGLQAIVTKSLRQASTEEAPILAWPLVCGSSVAKRTRAVMFANGILQIEVADAAWRAELQTIAAKYLAILNRYVGNRVERIEFVIANEKKVR